MCFIINLLINNKTITYINKISIIDNFKHLLLIILHAMFCIAIK